ncbi:MAG: ATP-dependent helicase [Actinobacteria bacterium]|nr:MAG: ATP-dependent helicase [Actinomycetota bacterium]
MTTTFSQLGLPTALVKALDKQGLTEPFPIQTATIRDVADGRDVAGRAPTGSGKTLAFGLPILATVAQARPNRPKALILAPTRELAEQIRRDLAPYGKAMHRQVFAIYGGVRYQAQKDWMRRGVDVLVATPGRLEDLIEQGSVDLSEVNIVTVDEADRMADMGFLPTVRRILNQTSKDRQTLLFSATLDGDVAVLIREYQNEPVRHEAGTVESETTDAEHHFWLVENDEKVQHTANIVGVANRSIVFTRTRHGADRLAKQLSRIGVGAVAMHGGRSQNQRRRALQSFASGEAQALIATDVAARGIHIDAVASVVHFDPPADHKDYLHRSGRTARAGAAGTVISLVTGSQKRAVRRIQDKLDLRHPIEKRSPGRADRPRREEPRPSKQQHPKRARSNKKSERPIAIVDHPAPRTKQKRKPTPDGTQSLHVSNLPWEVTDDDVRVLFSPYGRVKQATVIIDNRGRSKGFGFVDMPYPDAQRAMRTLDGSRLSGRPLKVKVAASRAKRN